jgi:hypothetical protein
MALSLAPQVLWDFQRVTTPLTDTVAAITLTAADGAAANTTDGLVIPATAWSDARVAKAGSCARLRARTPPHTRSHGSLRRD